jgi:hypothetical protein
MRRRALAVVAVVIGVMGVIGVATACVDDGPSGQGAAGGCQATRIAMASIGFPEVAADTSGGTVYGLLFTTPPITAGSEVKIVWRVTGTGLLSVVAADPSGAAHPLAWGPELHGDSNWDRPGAEWGTGVVFDRPGCWHLRAAREGVQGDVWLDVVA